MCVWVCFCFCLCVDSNSYNSISMCTLTHRIPSGDGGKRKKKKKDLRWEKLLFMRRRWVIIWAVGLYCFHFFLFLFAFTIEINARLCTGITDFDSFRKGLFRLLFLCFLYIDAITHQYSCYYRCWCCPTNTMTSYLLIKFSAFFVEMFFVF